MTHGSWLGGSLRDTRPSRGRDRPLTPLWARSIAKPICVNRVMQGTISGMTQQLPAKVGIRARR